MVYVITCGDEGVQINEGTRLAVVGAGVRFPKFSDVVTAIKKTFGDDIRLASSEENDWVKEQLKLSNWEQVNASVQQHTEALADQEKLLYSGYLPFSDPRQLKNEVKGHMVRPHGIHIANKICMTIGGGEQTYNLGHYVISADWVEQADSKLVKEVMDAQIKFYSKLSGGKELPIELEEEGELDEAVKEKNKAVLKKLGYIK